MFKGEKTSVFWAGLIILGLSSIVLFSVVWGDIIALTSIHVGGGFSFGFGQSLLAQVPIFVSTLVFILIGLYMMKTGTRKTQ